MSRAHMLLLCLVFSTGLHAQQSITTFILVRHAEKEATPADDPELKPEGKERAKRLAQIFASADIDAVYSTKFKRTRGTLAPLAEQKNKEVSIYDNIKPETLDQILSQHRGRTVMIGGHSNTIPQIGNYLLGRKEFENFQDNDYSNIIIVTVVEPGKIATFTLLKY